MGSLPLVLHIGYHKTGTTYLQTGVFNSHPEILFLGQPWINEEVGKFFREFKFTHDIDFVPVHSKTCFRQIVEYISLETGKQESSNKAKVLLVSLESLHSGPEWFGMNLTNMANRLRAVFSPCKIVLGIRNQADYIESNYKEYVVHGGKLGFKRFLYESFACNYCLLPKLQFDEVISLYRELFGDESVYVCLQERLKSNHSAELSSLMDFLGVDSSIRFEHRIVYKGLSKTSTECLRLLNKLVADDYNEQYYNVGVSEKWSRIEHARRRFSYRLRRVDEILRRIESRFHIDIISGNRYLDQDDIDYISEYFRESNKRLSDLIDLDISEFGYSC